LSIFFPFLAFSILLFILLLYISNFLRYFPYPFSPCPFLPPSTILIFHLPPLFVWIFIRFSLYYSQISLLGGTRLR
jgi:hypothetical protein